MQEVTECTGIWNASWETGLKPIALVAFLAITLLVGLNTALASQASEDIGGERPAIDAVVPFELRLDGLEKPTDGIASRYIITNTSDGAVNTSHTYYNYDDAYVASLDDTIDAPGASKVYRLAEIASFPAGYAGYAIIHADEPITGAVLPTPTPTPMPSPTPEPSALLYLPVVTRLHRPTQPLSTGDSVRFHGWLRHVPLEGVVTNSEFRSVLYPHHGDPVEAGDVFVVALMDVTNHGLESGEVGSYGFRLQDSAGRKFDIAGLDALFAAQDEYDRGSVYTAIQPGFTEQLVFVFDVLPKSAGLHLVSSDPW